MRKIPVKHSTPPISNMTVTNPNYYPMTQIGACMDIPECTLITGAKGETIINGGISKIYMITGAPNSFKSTVMTYISLAAANIVYTSAPTSIYTYDCENNKSIDRLAKLAERHMYIPEIDFNNTDAPFWSITNKTVLSGDDYTRKLFAEAEAKSKNKKA